MMTRLPPRRARTAFSLRLFSLSPLSEGHLISPNYIAQCMGGVVECQGLATCFLSLASLRGQKCPHQQRRRAENDDKVAPEAGPDSPLVDPSGIMKRSPEISIQGRKVSTFRGSTKATHVKKGAREVLTRREEELKMMTRFPRRLPQVKKGA